MSSSFMGCVWPFLAWSNIPLSKSMGTYLDHYLSPCKFAQILRVGKQFVIDHGCWVKGRMGHLTVFSSGNKSNMTWGMPTKLLQTLGQVLLGQQNWVVCKCVTVEPPYLCNTRASWSLFLGSSSCSKDLWNSLLAASETPKELNLHSILASKIVGYSYSTQ
jgi:hypothetical protein